MKKALIAMSGGVDSSVAAYLTIKEGYDCMGVTMKLHNQKDLIISNAHTCCSLDDIEDARKVSEKLHMPYSVENFSENFKEMVLDNFIYCYENGMTPNPCIRCNRYLKFDKLVQKAKEMGCEIIVTGHYAIVEQNPETGRYMLKKAIDASKDQSYVLYTISQEMLSIIRFPLGKMLKSEARDLAEANGFTNARKRDSEDLCFVPVGKYTDFIRKQTGKDYPPGDFVSLNGEVMGQHQGIIGYTIGQRKGLGLSLKEPAYVTELDMDNNRVILGRNEDLFKKELWAEDVNMVSVAEITEPIRVKAKVRYRHQEQWATAEMVDGRLHVVFDEPQRAITKGQAVVLYDDDIVVAGGTITEIGDK